ncbi:MAG TPA: hypothetical protein DCS55_12050 [Acidimicrobiaceae bacterium]|nr:hypothetical protein [Acidimicrobiaceae bacterium]
MIVHRLQYRVRPTVLVATAAAIVAAVRSLGSVWLPHVSDGMTRQHRTSVAVLVVATIMAVLLLASSRRVRTNEPVASDG